MDDDAGGGAVGVIQAAAIRREADAVRQPHAVIELARVALHVDPIGLTGLALPLDAEGSSRIEPVCSARHRR